MSGSRSFAWSDLPGLVCFALLGVVVLLQFLTRYVLNDSLAWTEEVARYLLIATAYAGSVTALRKGEHIFLELTYRLAPKVNVKPLAIIADAVVVLFHAALTVFAIQLSQVADRRMISVDLPKSLVYGFVAVMLGLSTIYAVVRLVRRSRQSSDEIFDDIESAAVGTETP